MSHDDPNPYAQRPEGEAHGATAGQPAHQGPYQHQPPAAQQPDGQAYAQPYQQPYQPTYQQGYPQYAPATYPPGQSAWGPLTGWGGRVLANLIDGLVALPAMVISIVGLALAGMNSGTRGHYDSVSQSYVPGTPGNDALIGTGLLLMVLGYVVAAAIGLWNRTFRMGRTGQSIGKKVMGQKLVDERTGQPLGAGMCFVRELAHYVDGAIYIGYLWPLWDAKRQTLADKIMSTVVLDVPKTPKA